MGLKHLTVWSCCQQFIGLLLARTTRQSSILKQRSVPFTIGANTRKRPFGQITFARRGRDLRNRAGSRDPESGRALRGYFSPNRFPQGLTSSSTILYI